MTTGNSSASVTSWSFSASMDHESDMLSGTVKPKHSGALFSAGKMMAPQVTILLLPMYSQAPSVKRIGTPEALGEIRLGSQCSIQSMRY